MRTHTSHWLTAALLASLSCSSASSPSSPGDAGIERMSGPSTGSTSVPPTGPAYLPLEANPARITDLALIYAGGTTRRNPDWTADDFAPYVSTQIQGPTEWLFDGFLLLDLTTTGSPSYSKNSDRAFVSNLVTPKTFMPATRADWMTFVDQMFTADHAVYGLDEAVRAAGTPARRRKVILMIPSPIPSPYMYGSGATKAAIPYVWDPSGAPSSLATNDNRLAAVKEYVEYALAAWAKDPPQDVDLAGFYWLEEHVASCDDGSPTDDCALLWMVATYLHGLGTKFFWIPSWHGFVSLAQGVTPQALGFDQVYVQPNYFQDVIPVYTNSNDLPELRPAGESFYDGRIASASALALRLGIGVEVEFDLRVRDSIVPGDYSRFHPRFQSYLEGFSLSGVRLGASVAYYQGNAELGYLATTAEAIDRETYEYLADFVISRQALADEESLVGVTGCAVTTVGCPSSGVEDGVEFPDNTLPSSPLSTDAQGCADSASTWFDFCSGGSGGTPDS